MRSTKLLTCPLIRSTHADTTASSLRLRSVDRPEGSPISPVAPPTSAMGMCPCCWNRRSVNSGTRLPTCRLAAVGSNPQYRRMELWARRRRKPSSSVVWATSPRHCRSDRRSGLSGIGVVVTVASLRMRARMACELSLVAVRIVASLRVHPRIARKGLTNPPRPLRDRRLGRPLSVALICLPEVIDLLAHLVGPGTAGGDSPRQGSLDGQNGADLRRQVR